MKFFSIRGEAGRKKSPKKAETRFEVGRHSLSRMVEPINGRFRRAEYEEGENSRERTLYQGYLEYWGCEVLLYLYMELNAFKTLLKSCVYSRQILLSRICFETIRPHDVKIEYPLVHLFIHLTGITS